MSISSQLNIWLFSVYRSFPVKTLNKRNKTEQNVQTTNVDMHSWYFSSPCFSIFFCVMLLFNTRCNAVHTHAKPSTHSLCSVVVTLFRALHTSLCVWWTISFYFHSFYVDRTRILVLCVSLSIKSFAIVPCFSWKNSVQRNGCAVLVSSFNKNINTKPIHKFQIEFLQK